MTCESIAALVASCATMLVEASALGGMRGKPNGRFGCGREAYVLTLEIDQDVVSCAAKGSASRSRPLGAVKRTHGRRRHIHPFP